MLSFKIRMFFKRLFWTKKEKEFYDIFHINARMQRVARKHGYVDLDAMVMTWKIRKKEKAASDRAMREEFNDIFEKIRKSGGDVTG